MLCDFIYLMMALKGRDIGVFFSATLPEKRRTSAFLWVFFRLITAIVYLTTVTEC